MASRVNRFLQTDNGLAESVKEENTMKDYTSEMAKTLNERAIKEEKQGELLYANPTMFIPYEDSKLALDLYEGEEFERLKESIKQNGIMQPVICVPKDDKYMLLAGRHRVRAAQILGIEVPYILKKGLTKEEMDLIVIDTNLLNRQISDYKPSQLAYVLKKKMDAEKHQGVKIEGAANTIDIVKEGYGLNKTAISRYIKLNELCDEVLDIVDKKEITLKAGYELAFFDFELQKVFINFSNQIKLNDKFINEIRKEVDNEKFESQKEKILFVKEKIINAASTNKSRKFDYRKIKKYIPETVTDSKIEEYVIEALKYYALQSEKR